MNLAPAWGTHTIGLNLPGAPIRVSGLSASQSECLSENYRDYLSVNGNTASPEMLECRVHRFDGGQPLSEEAMTRDGQYAPLKTRSATDSSFELRGLNFSAWVATSYAHGPSHLGVAYEHELAQPIVFENFLRVLIAHRALALGGVILHSAGLVYDGKAYIFCGRSNAGKTTLTRKAHERGAKVLSDDINLVLPSQGSYHAHAVPFTGEFGRTIQHADAGNSYPVAGIILLRQSDVLRLEPISAAGAVSALLVGCPFVNMDEQESSALFDAVTGLVSTLPVIALHNRREDDVDDIMRLVTARLAG